MQKRLRKTIQKSLNLFLGFLAMFSTTKLYGMNNDNERCVIFHNFFPESFFSFLVIMNIAFGAFKAWQQKSARPLIFFGGIGVAIMMIF